MGIFGGDHDLAVLEPIVAQILALEKSCASILNQLQQGETRIMSAITDTQAKVDANFASFNTTLASIVAGIASLDQKIQNLQNTQTSLSPADQAALDEMSAESTAFLTNLQNVSTAPPPPPSGSGTPSGSSATGD